MNGLVYKDDVITNIQSFKVNEDNFDQSLKKQLAELSNYILDQVIMSIEKMTSVQLDQT